MLKLSTRCWLGYAWIGATIGSDGLVIELLAQILLILFSLLFDLLAVETELSLFKHAEFLKRQKSQKLFRNESCPNGLLLPYKLFND